MSQLYGRLGLIVQMAGCGLGLVGRLASCRLRVASHALGRSLSLLQHLGVNGLTLLHGDLALGDQLFHQFLGFLRTKCHGAHAGQEHVFQSIGNRRHFEASVLVELASPS
ncbi:MAG: hypothetical protein ACLTDR_13725 [Adlercreutzia equolifaciens]